MKKILIIDDDIDIQNLFADNLQRYGYEVYGETDGRKAVNRIRQEKPNLVILDILLPYIHGFSICQQMKNDNELKDTKVIFVSAKSYDSDIKKAYELGGDYFLAKPFKWEELLDKIEDLLNED